MYFPMAIFEPIKAMIVPNPVTVNTVGTGNPINRAHNTVAGNIVSTCCRPSRII